MQQLHLSDQKTETTPLPIQAIEETPVHITPAELETGAPPDILRLIKRLRRRSPVRKIAEELLHKSQPLDTIAPLLDAFTKCSDSRWKEQMVAAWALGVADCSTEQKKEAAQTLGKALEQRDSGKRSWGRFLRVPGRAALLASPLSIGLMSIVFLYVKIRFPGSDMNLGQGTLVRYDALPPALCITLTLLDLFLRIDFGLAFILLPVILPLSIVLDSHRANQVWAEAAVTLGRLQDPQSIAPLTAAMQNGDKHVRQAAATALRQLLPLLTPEHYGQLCAQTVPNLCRLLTHRSESFVLLVLEALDKIGNGGAVPAVERLANYSPTIPIGEAAAQTLQTLKVRQQQERNAQHLLRASQSSAPETLLRAVDTISETGSQELLRVAEHPAAERMEA